MTGPEHFRRAEQMVALYASEMEEAAADNDAVRIEAITSLIAPAMAAAQVHATLALASVIAHAEGGAAGNASDYGGRR